MTHSKDIKVHTITTETDQILASNIRREVFVFEQNVPTDVEYDEFETISHHVLAKIGGQAVGTARWRDTNKGIKLERFAVLKPFRHCGVGSALLKYILEQIGTDREIYLNSQLSALAFYEAHGFKARGDVFYEANIPHRKMILNP